MSQSSSLCIWEPSPNDCDTYNLMKKPKMANIRVVIADKTNYVIISNRKML